MIDKKTAKRLIKKYNAKISQLIEVLMTNELEEQEILKINNELKGYISAKSHIQYRTDNHNKILKEDELISIIQDKK